MRKKVMISQPMAGLDKGEIIETRELARYKLLKAGYEVVDSFVVKDPPKDVTNTAVWYLSKSIEVMSKVDAVYFCNGWANARGCLIEHHTAQYYGLECLHEGEIVGGEQI